MVRKLIIFIFACQIHTVLPATTDASPVNELYSVALICPEEPFNLAWDRLNKRYLVLMKDSFYFLGRDSIRWVKMPYQTNEFSDDFDFYLIDVLTTDNRTLLVLNSGGYVFELKGNSIFRIDKSFNQRSQFGSTKFMLGDTVVSYGGYGFWNYHNFFTYFSSETREWEMLGISSDNPMPERRSHQAAFYDRDKMDYYIFQGQSTRYQARDPYATYLVGDIWKINLTSKKWKRLGKINKNLPLFDSERMIERHNEGLFFENVALYKIDFKSNKVRIFENDQNFGQTVNINYEIGYNPEDDEIIYVNHGNAVRPDMIRIAPVSGFFSSKSSDTFLYVNIWKYVKAGIILIAFIPLFLIIRFIRRRKVSRQGRLVFNTGSGVLRFNKINITLEENEKKLLMKLSGEDRYFSMVELYDIISEGQHSLDVLKKKKKDIFDSINKKTGFATNGQKDLFLKRKYAGDKRLIEVKINDRILKIIR